MKIALFQGEKSPTSSAPFLTQMVTKAFEDLGHEVRHFFLTDPFDPTLLLRFHPDFTLSFFNMLICELEKPLCDYLKIPHVQWVRGAPENIAGYLNAPYGFVAYNDRTLITQKAKQQLLFIPDGVHATHITPPTTMRPFEVVLFANLNDHDPTIQNIIESLGSVRIDVFGKHQGKNWLIRLKNGQNVFLHAPLPFETRLDLLRQTKLFVHHIIDGQDASSFWFLQAVACGALPLSNGSKYLSEHFAAPYYNYADLFDSLTAMCHYYLKEEKQREELCINLQKNLQFHDFTATAQYLIEALFKNLSDHTHRGARGTP